MRPGVQLGRFGIAQIVGASTLTWARAILPATHQELDAARKRDMANESKPSFDAWFLELRKLAAEHDLLWLIGDDPRDFHDAYQSGQTPAEELSEQVAACSAD